MERKFEIEFVNPVEDIEDDNIDIFIKFDTGEAYAATVFTPKNILTLMNRWKQSGECLGGSYFWVEDMIIVERLTMDIVHDAVNAVIESGKLEKAFILMDTSED
jgi:hypothetical protein